MAPSKFGLFKSRSREQSDQPSSENLIHSSTSSESVAVIPLPSSSEVAAEEMAQAQMVALSMDDLTIEKHPTPKRRASESGRQDSSQIGYRPLQHQPSTELTSTSTLQDEDFDLIEPYEDVESTRQIDPRPLDNVDDDGASTSCDANSLQFDETSLAPSEDPSVYCARLKKPKKSRSKEEEQIMRDCGMWHASNVEVMQNLLSRSGTLDDQIKWQAIATTRGLCTLTDSCVCCDCHRAKFLAGMADGDGGLGAAPLIGAVSFGCTLQ